MESPHLETTSIDIAKKPKYGYQWTKPMTVAVERLIQGSG
jgi:hypothetical protein